MDKKNILILGFAIVAIGLFVIPSTMSMFVGQHRWYSVRTVDDQYDLCERCHAAEVGEWKANTGAHNAYRVEGTVNGTDPGCFCHQINETRLEDYGFTGITEFNFEIFNESGNISNESTTWSDGWRTNATPHAAITIACVDCHYNATAQLSNEHSAHKQFQNVAVNATLADGVKNTNTACLACHTMVGLNITMERVWSGIDISANHTNYTAGNAWDLTVTINGTKRTNNSTWWAPNGTST